MTDPAYPLPDEPGGLSHSPAEDPSGWDSAPERSADPAPPREPLRLTTSNDLSESVAYERPIAPVRPPRPASEERSVGPTPWTAAASSVPRIKIGAAPPADDETDFDVPPRPLRPVVAATPEHEAGFGDEPGAEDAFPNDRGDRAKPMVAAPVRKLDEPFWVVAMDELQSNPRILVLSGVGLVLILAAWMFWPRAEKGVSLHELRSHPDRYDAQTVRLEGRVGEVFNVGAGWAYNLHQGRDTIVVFTRGIAPHTRDRIAVTGSVSTGWLDGKPRQAIFATP